MPYSGTTPSSSPNSQGSLDPSKIFVWVKSLESKLNTLMREVDLVKNDLIRKNTALAKEVKAQNSELLEMKRELEQFTQKMDLIIKELKHTAGAEEVAVIKKYIELWNPLQFVTQRDLERAIDAQLLLKLPPSSTLKNSSLPSTGLPPSPQIPSPKTPSTAPSTIK